MLKNKIPHKMKIVRSKKKKIVFAKNDEIITISSEYGKEKMLYIVWENCSCFIVSMITVVVWEKIFENNKPKNKNLKYSFEIKLQK